MRKIQHILVANRGEIAIRIMQTARKMGIESWAVKTAREPRARYLNKADHVVDLTDQPSDMQEFLDIERLLIVARDNGIDAIHPGYGFLAENPYFAKRCEEEGIVFIGPAPDVIYKMGNKTIARDIARKQQIPLLQGSVGSVGSVDEALKIAGEIGYPVILKAASGGGGRGMRVVEKEKEMERMFRLATQEAGKAFNDPSVFLEKYISNPRHIEFQVFGDTHGNVVHLGERECSVQRKHQKLIEEAPSAALDEELRQAMGADAIRITEAVKYHSAGTVEFLLGDDRNYYFMEMNTRIQVEHPVTEMITGTDLIEWQIRVARGEKLPLMQKDIQLRGWAMEFRINAEDSQAGFSPSLGTIQNIQFPRSSHVRIDSGVVEGSVVSPYFDSMLAKLIVFGESREKLLAYAKTALRNFWITGIKTTIPFCRAVISHPRFRKGVYSTAFIGQMKRKYVSEPEEEIIAAWLASRDYAGELQEEKNKQPDYRNGSRITPWVLKKRLKSF